MRSLKKILLIIICSFILTKITGLFIDKGFKNYYVPFFEKMELVFKDTSYNDILYFGNSRANFGINPYFIDSICKTKSYNLGFGGSDIAGAISFLRSYLINHPAPTYLVYSYDHRMFHLRQSMELAPVYFYYTNYKPVRDELQRFGYHETFLHFFPDLKYCFFNDYYRTCFLKGLIGESLNDPVKQKNIEKHLYDHNGYVNYQTGGLIQTDYDTTMPAILTECKTMFDTLINICNQNKIKNIFIYPPELYGPQTETKELTERKNTIDNIVMTACKKNNFYYKRFDTNDFQKNDFTDPEHVNIYGSKKYSIKLGDYLKSIMK